MNDIQKKCCRECGTELSADVLFCNACGNRISEMCDSAVLQYGACPDCGRYDTLGVQSTQRPVRHVKCKKCGFKGKTIEVFLFPGSLQAAIEITKDRRRF